MLGIAVNSRKKEVYIDSILKLSETQQVALMGLAVKYIDGERKSVRELEADIAATLHQQLQDKEADALLVFESVRKLEQENKRLCLDLENSQAQCKILIEENQLLRDEFTKSADSTMETFNLKEKELELENTNLSEQLESARKELKLQAARYKELEMTLQDEVSNSKRKSEELNHLKDSIQKLRQQLEALKDLETQKECLERELERDSQKMNDLARENRELLREYRRMESEYYLKRTEHKAVVEAYKDEQRKCAGMAEEVRTLKEKSKYLENCVRQAEEAENKENLVDFSADSFALQELRLKQRISQLEEEVRVLEETSNVKLTARVNELEADLNAEMVSKSKLEEEIKELAGRYEELNRLYGNALEEVEKARVNSSEYQRVRRDRDTLLLLIANAQEISKKYEELKSENEGVRRDNETAMEQLKIHLRDKELLEEQVREKTGKNLELEKTITRLEERILVLKEEYKKSDDLIKNAMNTKNETSILAKQQEEVIKLLRAEMEQLKAEHDSKVASLRNEMERERTAAKAALQELSEMSKQQESMFVSSMQEIEVLMTKMMADKKVGSSSKVSIKELMDANLDA